MTDDPPKRIPANENPWYRLATVHGEQPVDGDIDLELHDRNRATWNRRVGQVLTEDDRAALIKTGRFTEDDFSDPNDDDRNAVAARFDGMSYPDLNSTIDWRDTDFPKNSCFFGFVFFSAIVAQRAAFQGDAFFREAAFKGYTGFREAAFQGDADFHAAAFQGGADFYKTMFEGTAYFREAAFQGDAYFLEAAFQGDADFREAAFRGDADFHDSKFLERVLFRAASFERNFYFSVSSRLNNKEDSHIRFADFSRAIFNGSVIFDRRIFEEEVLFVYSVFKGNIPNLDKVEFPNGFDFKNTNWDVIHIGKMSWEDIELHYKKLHIKMLKESDFDSAQYFYCMMLECQIYTRLGWDRFLIKTYYVLSDFGRSSLRPAVWMLSLWAIFAPMYHGVLLVGDEAISLKSAYGFSAASLGGLFGLSRVYYEEISSVLPWGLTVLSSCQSIFGAVFVFLIGLALRNRFRIR